MIKYILVIFYNFIWQPNFLRKWPLLEFDFEIRFNVSMNYTILRQKFEAMKKKIKLCYDDNLQITKVNFIKFYVYYRPFNFV